MAVDLLSSVDWAADDTFRAPLLNVFVFGWSDDGRLGYLEVPEEVVDDEEDRRRRRRAEKFGQGSDSLSLLSSVQEKEQQGQSESDNAQESARPRRVSFEDGLEQAREGSTDGSVSGAKDAGSAMSGEGGTDDNEGSGTRAGTANSVQARADRAALTAPQSRVNPQPLPTFDADAAPVISASAGNRHSLFLQSNGRVMFAGLAGSLFVRNPVVHHPRRVPGLETAHIVQVAAGYNYSVAISDQGAVFTWGNGAFGVLGHGDEIALSMPRMVVGLHEKRIVHVSAGQWHVVAMDDEHTMYSWGRNHCGQLGVGSISYCVPAPREISWVKTETPVTISAGGQHSVALIKLRRANGKEQNTVFGWGDASRGQLGDLTDTNATRPQELRNVTAYLQELNMEAEDIKAGGAHNVLLLMSVGQMVSWGAGTYGQLGTGNNWDRNYPMLVPGARGFTAVSAGQRHCLALREEDGELWAWGYNGYGECGLDDQNLRLFPTKVKSLERATSLTISAGYRHSVVVLRREPRTAQEEPLLRPMFEAIKTGGRLVARVLRKDLQGRGVDSGILEEPNAVLSGQPGMTDESVHFAGFEPGLQYCMDTKVDPKDWRRKGYETCFRVPAYGLESVCLACARRCHAGTYVDTVFRARLPGSICDCQATKHCLCRWTPVRAQFDTHAWEDGGIRPNQLRELLTELRRPIPITEEDVEAAVLVLGSGHEHDDTTVIMPVPFETWYAKHYTS